MGQFASSTAFITPGLNGSWRWVVRRDGQVVRSGGAESVRGAKQACERADASVSGLNGPHRGCGTVRATHEPSNVPMLAVSLAAAVFVLIGVVG
jgi:hypothetical protein